MRVLFTKYSVPKIWTLCFQATSTSHLTVLYVDYHMLLYSPLCIETSFLDRYSAHEDDEDSQPREALDGKRPKMFKPLYQHNSASDYQLQEHPQNGKGAGPRVELSDDDYDGPEMHTRRPVYEVAGGIEEAGLPPSIQLLGVSSPEMSALPEELEDSFLTRTEPRPSDRAYLDEELKAQDTGLQDVATGGKPDMRSRHTSAASGRSQPSLTAAPPEIMRQQSNHSKGGRRAGGKTEHELTRFEGRARPTRNGQIRRGRYRSVYLNEGEQHRVWLPRLQTDMEISPPTTVQSPPSFNHSFSMTDIYGKEVGRELSSPDPVKNLVTNRKRLESRVKAAQEVGRQVSGCVVVFCFTMTECRYTHTCTCPSRIHHSLKVQLQLYTQIKHRIPTPHKWLCCMLLFQRCL